MREELVGAHRPRVVSGGVFRPWAIVNGCVTGIWKWAGGSVKLELFGDMSGRAARALEREAADLARFLTA